MKLKLIECQTKGDTETELAIDTPDLEKYTAECGCPVHIVSQEFDGTVFERLDVDEKYFPMVARNYDQAFFGVPPESLSPIGLEMNADRDDSGSSSSANEDTITADEKYWDSPTCSLFGDDNPVDFGDEKATKTALVAARQIEARVKQGSTLVSRVMPETRDLFCFMVNEN
jgi:hypothetical protein